MTDAPPVKRLSEEQCLRLLENETVGRLAVSVGGHPDIFPINYAWYEGKVIFRTAEGSKLTASTINPAVAFEIDGYTDTVAWSVTLRGTIALAEGETGNRLADESGLTPWIPTHKMNILTIAPSEITGRLFQRGEQPDTDL